jgi:hypothetical protein
MAPFSFFINNDTIHKSYKNKEALMREDIKVGALFPDYELPDHTNVKRKLSLLQGNDPMIPHTFVLEPGLKIYKIYNGYWYWGRPSTAELHQDLREISLKYRADFKIDTPEMRKKWESEQRDDFYPYGKTWEEVFIRMAGDVEKF